MTRTKKLDGEICKTLLTVFSFLSAINSNTLLHYELELIREPVNKRLIFTSGIDELVIQLKLEYFD